MPPNTSGAYETLSVGVTRLNVACMLGLAERGTGEPLTLGLQADARIREQRTLAGIDVLLRLAQRGLRGIEIGIGVQRLLDQAIERRGAEQRPPVAGNVALGMKCCASPPRVRIDAVCVASGSGV